MQSHSDEPFEAVPAYRDARLHGPDSFTDALYDWMERAPWMALSALAHGLLLLILMVIPWDLLRDEPEIVIVTTIEHVPDEVFEEPPQEEPLPIEEEDPVDEPVLMPSEEPVEAPSDFVGDTTGELDLSESAAGDPSNELSPLLGIGGGGGKFDGRGPGGSGGGGRGTQKAVAEGLEWLARHQSPDGSWDSDGFSALCGQLGATTCSGEGGTEHDVGMTGLALLAFLGNGNTKLQGEYRDVVRGGIRWLKQAQDADTGLLGQRIGHGFLYNHAIGALALTESYYFTPSPLDRRSAQSAIDYISRARNPYGAWRYDVPPVGDNDTSVTGWMVLALKSAEDAGLEVDSTAYAGALSWFDEVTDPSTGRTGYDTLASPSSRIERINDHYPTDKGEAMTAVALLCRFFLGQDPEQHPIMETQARLLSKRLPEWNPDGYGCDMYYWYYGSYAMYQMGGSAWTTWQKAMEQAVVGSQRREGDERGSWDPVGPWGSMGGRVYSTALMTLCLEVYYRYSRVLGAR